MRQAAGSSDEGAKLFVASTLYEKRGLSMDTSLLVNYAIESTLVALKSKGVLSPGSIRRIGVIGPGLDFADKREGSDSYPLQTIQPFAVMVLRWRYAVELLEPSLKMASVPPSNFHGDLINAQQT